MAIEKEGENIKIILPAGDYYITSGGIATSITGLSKNIWITCENGVYKERPFTLFGTNWSYSETEQLYIKENLNEPFIDLVSQSSGIVCKKVNNIAELKTSTEPAYYIEKIIQNIIII